MSTHLHADDSVAADRDHQRHRRAAPAVLRPLRLRRRLGGPARRHRVGPHPAQRRPAGRLSAGRRRRGRDGLPLLGSHPSAAAAVPHHGAERAHCGRAGRRRLLGDPERAARVGCLGDHRRRRAAGPGGPATPARRPVGADPQRRDLGRRRRQLHPDGRRTGRLALRPRRLRGAGRRLLPDLGDPAASAGRPDRPSRPARYPQDARAFFALELVVGDDPVVARRRANFRIWSAGSSAAVARPPGGRWWSATNCRSAATVASPSLPETNSALAPPTPTSAPCPCARNW